MTINEDFNDASAIAAGELLAAAAEGRLQAVAKLLAAGADINEKDEDGMTPLMHAAMQGHTEIADMLVKAGAALDEQETARGGWTALMLATRCGRGYEKIVRRLAAQGADLGMKNKEGATALHIAGENIVYSAVAAALIEFGAPLEAKDDMDRTPLLRALDWDGNDEAARHLVRAGASLDISDVLGNSALTLAAIDGKVETVRLMIEKGADLDKTEKDGLNALQIVGYCLNDETSDKYDRHVQIADLLQRGPEIFREARAEEERAQAAVLHAKVAARQKSLRQRAPKVRPSCP